MKKIGAGLMRVAALASVLVGGPGGAVAGDGAVAVPPAAGYPIDVRAGRVVPEWTSARPPVAATALESLPGVVLNSQGGAAGQSDMTILGSSFSGAGLSVEGVALRNPQTEHFNVELPLPTRLFMAPAVLSGLDQALLSSGHLAGSVEWTFAPVRPGIDVRLGMGESGWDWQDGDLRWVSDPTRGTLTAVSVFGTREQMDGIDRADNDVDRTAGGVHLQTRGDALQVDLAVGVQEKEFGTRGYYGVTPDWDSQERIEDRLFMLAGRWRRGETGYLRAVAAWREFEDEYFLTLPDPPVFYNQHDSQIGSVALDGREERVPGATALRWRIGGESEDVESNRLGDQDRRRGDMMLAPEWTAHDATLSLGARAVDFSEGSDEVLPLAGVSVNVTPRDALFVSYTETVREPSYTELNYESPGSLGDRGLENEQAREWQAGWRMQAAARRLQLRGFARQTRHTVDWVKETAESPRWVATDLGTVDVAGVEVSGRQVLFDCVFVDFAYLWTDKDLAAEVYAGRYVVDYPEHVFKFRTEWVVSDGVRVAYSDTLRWQVDTPVRDGGDEFGTNGRLALNFRPAAWQRMLEFSLACDNLWDDDFDVFVDQPAPVRRVSAALAYAWR